MFRGFSLFQNNVLIINSILIAMSLFAEAGSSAKSLQASSQNKTHEGRLEFHHEDDFKNGKSRERYYLKTDSGQRFELQFKDKGPRNLAVGSRVRVNGTQSGETTLALDSSGGVQVLAQAALPNTFGEHKVLVMMVNFQDNATQPFTLADVNSVVFTQTNNFMRENSFQQTWISGNAYGWYTLPIASTCDSLQVISYGEQAATAAGINLANYSHHVYLMPKNMPCGWSGSGTMGGSPASIVINGSLEAKVVAHEFGHNLGLDHSHGLSCGASTIGSSCTNIEYGDAADVMGNTGTGHFNAFQKERLGWLNNGTTPPITMVQASGSYALEPYETASSNPKALKILKSVDPATGARTWYYIEYRQAIGFDAYLAMLPISNYMSGVVIHTGSESGSGTSFLLDMTPNSDSTSWDWYDAALAAGKSFTDTAAGVTITPTWANGTGAAVDVSFSSTPTSSCTRANPSVTLSPSSQSGSAGSVLSYNLSVKNNDSSGCASSTFNLTKTIPTGWSGSLASASLSLAPGASGSTTLAVTSPLGAAAGSYSLSATVTNSSSTTNSGSSSATYTVSAIGTLSATVSTSQATYSRNSTATMIITATSGGQPVANATVAVTITKPNSSTVTQTAITNASGQAQTTLQIAKGKTASGTYQVRVTVTSGGQSASANTSFVVQ